MSERISLPSLKGFFPELNKLYPVTNSTEDTSNTNGSRVATLQLGSNRPVISLVECGKLFIVPYPISALRSTVPPTPDEHNPETYYGKRSSCAN